MVTYPGLPAPKVEVIVDHDSSRERYQNKSEFLIASLHLCGNTGTYVDSPLHRYRGATDLAGLPLERVAHVPVRVFDARSLGRAVGPELFRGADVRGAAVLVRTDFSQHWRTERYGRENPFLTAEACEAARGRGSRLGRHRLGEHRRHHGHGASGAHDPARGGDSDLRAHDEPGRRCRRREVGCTRCRLRGRAGRPFRCARMCSVDRVRLKPDRARPIAEADPVGQASA